MNYSYTPRLIGIFLCFQLYSILGYCHLQSLSTHPSGMTYNMAKSPCSHTKKRSKKRNDLNSFLLFHFLFWITSHAHIINRKMIWKVNFYFGIYSEEITNPNIFFSSIGLSKTMNLKKNYFLFSYKTWFFSVKTSIYKCVFSISSNVMVNKCIYLVRCLMMTFI